MTTGLPDNSTSVHLRDVDLDRLDRFAQALVRHFPTSVTLGLCGTLGAGKTRLVQAIADAFGIDRHEVTSPTFTLVQTHVVPEQQGGTRIRKGGPTRFLHHLDAYRVADEVEFLDVGVHELFDSSDGWSIIEWADRVADVIPIDTVWIQIGFEANGERRKLRIWTNRYRDIPLDAVIRDVEPKDTRR